MREYVSDYVKLGNRKYIQVTTMFNEIVGALDRTTLCKASIECKNQLFSQAIISEYGPEEVATVENPNAIVYVRTTEGTRTYVIKAMDVPACASVPYDEDAMVGAGAIDGERKSISLSYRVGEDLSNMVVAANKRLLNTIMDTDGFTSWVAAKFELQFDKISEFYQQDKTELCVENVSNLMNIYTKSIIRLNDVIVGEVYFARRTKA